MRFIRKPSWKKSFKARTTGKYKRRMKRAINPYYGRKGAGWGHNHKRALYNKMYHRTTRPLFTPPRTRRTTTHANLQRQANEKLIPYHQVNNNFDVFLNVLVVIINNLDKILECVVIIAIIVVLIQTMFTM